MNYNDNSVYKLIYSNDGISGNSLNPHSKNIRNNYLKKLAETNEDYFPSELKLDKIKRNIAVSYEEKFNFKNQLGQENELNFEKNKGKENKKENKNQQKKAERKSSLIFDPPRKDSVENNLDEKKKNGDANNNVNPNKKNKVIEDEESDKEESNQEEQSYDEYRMESEEAVSDVGGDSDGGDFSDGGVF